MNKILWILFSALGELMEKERRNCLCSSILGRENIVDASYKLASLLLELRKVLEICEYKSVMNQ